MPNQMDSSYRYRRSSEVVRTGDDLRAVLATSSRDLASPWFFEGAVRAPELVAAMLLGVAAVARARFSLTASVIAALRDPVVTANAGLLRFESFSHCNGVYARFDYPLDEWSSDLQRDVGTTNVDFNDSMLSALSGVSRDSGMILSVGEDAVAVETVAGEVVERRVPLSGRWVRGFSEVAVAMADVEPAFDVAPNGLRSFLAVPGAKAADRPLYLTLGGRDLRLSTRAKDGAVLVGGAARLRLVEPLLRFARRVQIYGHADQSGPLVCVLDLDDTGGSRFTIAISPDSSRGFSGEGNVLHAMAGASEDVVEGVRQSLCWQPALDQRTLSGALDRPLGEIDAAMAALAAAGLVGFDVGRQAYFHRELPYPVDASRRVHPRLRSAERTVAAGGVQLIGTDGDTEEYLVTGSGGDHLVRLHIDDVSCTCSWWFRYRGQRGPCQHVTATRLTRARATGHGGPG